MEPITGNSSVMLPAPRVAPVTPAAALLGAAESLVTGVEPLVAYLPATSWPLTFLSGQVVECALKAYLADRGLSETDLKAIGHNLLELWTRATAHDLAFGSGPPVWLQRLSELH